MELTDEKTKLRTKLNIIMSQEVFGRKCIFGVCQFDDNA